MTFDHARQVIADAIANRAFPGASVEAGSSRGVVWREALGRLTYDAASAPTTHETIFDLASLTKVIATTTLAMSLVENGVVSLGERVADRVPEWRGTDRAAVTVRHLLEHASGLPAWLPLFQRHRGRDGFRAAIAAVPLEYPPGTASVYSDLGFMLLGFIVEDAAGAALDALFAQVRARLDLGDLTYLPPPAWRARTAPTEVDPERDRLLVGEVHDENAWALDGVAGHAGLFGTAEAAGRFARALLRARRGDEATAWPTSADTLLRFTTRGTVPGSSRALGWDTMLPTSSCGTEMSSVAFGHTGFTGTSLWIDPTLDLYVVLLSNRVHPTRENDRIAAVRPALHDAVVREFRSRG